jgi:hypothetical protein
MALDLWILYNHNQMMIKLQKEFYNEQPFCFF